jgi:hypothetical protein
MTPFSENASILFSEAAKIGRPFKWKHLKVYTDLPEFQNLQRKSVPLIQTLNGIVYYSNQVVAINNSRLEDKEKNKQLVRYLSDVLKKSSRKGRLDSLGFDEQSLKEYKKNIINAETYLGAIQAASPVVNSIVLSLQNSFDEIQNDIAIVITAMDMRIDVDFVDKRTNFVELKKLQSQTMATTTHLYRLMMGKDENLKALLIKDKSLEKYFPNNPTYTISNLEAAENSLLERLNRLNNILIQLSTDVADYYAKQDEMEEWRLNVDEKIRVARNAISVWAQSHRNLGAGVPVPPMIDVTGIATGMVGTAAGVALP